MTDDDAGSEGNPVGAVLQASGLLGVLAAFSAPLGVCAVARAAQVDTSPTFSVRHILHAEGIVASPEQKAHFLEPLVSGFARSALLMTSPLSTEARAPPPQ